MGELIQNKMKKQPITFEELLKYFKLNKLIKIRENHKKERIKIKPVKIYYKKDCDIIYLKCPECKNKKEWHKFRYKTKGIGNTSLICEDCKNV